MYTVHPTLLIGPADWRPDVMPKTEFDRRIDALWQGAPSASHAIVFGSPAHHAELAYFTNLVPKLEVAAAVLARSGAHRLFVGGGANMLGAARPLSFITDMLPLNGLITSLQQINESVLLVGGGSMTSALHQAVTGALRVPPQDASTQAWTLMRRRSPHELAAIESACAMLSAAVAAMHTSQRKGAAATDVVLAGERAANQAGAQEVRTLFSQDGGRTLVPFTTPVREPLDPLQVYVAVRAFNYWAEGFARVSSRTSPAAHKAAMALRNTIASIKAGTRFDDIAQTIADAGAPYRIHPVTTHVADAIGLALEAPPHIGGGEAFQAGEVYSLKIGLTDGRTEHAIVSAMIAVADSESGSRVLWQTPATA